MTRDFAKKPRPGARPRAASKKAGNRAGDGGHSAAPAWVWLLTGALLGALIVLLAYLSGIAPQPSTENSATEPAADGEAAKVTPKPRFDFYTLLKENEVSVRHPPGPTHATD